jgi:hypothetical protein
LTTHRLIGTVNKTGWLLRQHTTHDSCEDPTTPRDSVWAAVNDDLPLFPRPDSHDSRLLSPPTDLRSSIATMCIAELNVSTLPCRHRWYHLNQACHSERNLSNCPQKLALSGWEIKCDFCPFCASWDLDMESYRLVGNDRSPSIGGLSRSPSAKLSLASTRRDSRRGSLARSDSSSSIALAASEKNRAQNLRLDAYLSTRPEKILMMDVPAALDEQEEDVPPSPTTSGSSGDGGNASGLEAALPAPGAAAKRGSGRFSRSWNKSKRLSMQFFK